MNAKYSLDVQIKEAVENLDVAEAKELALYIHVTKDMPNFEEDSKLKIAVVLTKLTERTSDTPITLEIITLINYLSAYLKPYFTNHKKISEEVIAALINSPLTKYEVRNTRSLFTWVK